MKILSIDPSGIGGHTGIAFGSTGDDHDFPYTLVHHWHVSDEIDGLRKWLTHYGDIPDDWVILVEDFEDFGIRGADWTPLRLVGALQYLFGDRENFHLVRPAARKFVSDESMHSLGAYVAGGHHRDATEAARHAVAWLVSKQKHLPTIEKGWPHAERF